MKFLKQKTISRYSPSDNTLFTNHYGRAVMDLTGALRLPKGTTAERPDISGVRTPNGPDGYIRYNTETNTIEGYVAGVWKSLQLLDRLVLPSKHWDRATTQILSLAL